jgi:HEPN domain-containing protein
MGLGISQTLTLEARQIRRVIRCARGVLELHPRSKEAKRCLKLAEAKLELVRKLIGRHEGD